MVSIHASAREATFSRSDTGQLQMQFQSTPPHGRRQRLLAALERLGWFQSTPPHGRRRFLFALASCRKPFQSTPPHGRRRGIDAVKHLSHEVSIHASAREATSPPMRRARYTQVSIHASAREATHAGVFCPHGGECFNPRLRTGGDLGACTMRTVYNQVSIHASAREATCVSALNATIFPGFQSTPPHGRRPAVGTTREMSM